MAKGKKHKNKGNNVIVNISRDRYVGGIRKVPSDMTVECAICHRHSKLEEWDNNTFKECKSRDMVRSYIHLTEAKAFKAETEAYYLCPKCGNWMEGSHLICVSDKVEYQKLGRRPLVTVRGLDDIKKEEG